MDEQEKPGFKIGGAFYAAPATFRVGDAVLIREITGMAFPDFAEALDDDERRKDPVILAGLIAVAIWQAKPMMKREKVVKLVEQIDFESLNFQGGDDEIESVGGDAVPPVAAGAELS